MMYRIIPFGHHHEQEVPLIVLFNEQLSATSLRRSGPSAVGAGSDRRAG